MNDQKLGSDWETSEMLNLRHVIKSCAKGMMISFNLTCFMVAFWTFFFAVLDIKILKHCGEERASGSLIGDLIIIGLSVFLAGIAIMGCIGTVLNKVKILYWYVICIMILVALELLVAIFVSMERNGLEYSVSEWLQKDFYLNATRTDHKQSEHEEFWDALQSNYECCGLNGPKDYAVIGRPISISCCAKAYRAKTATAQRIMYQACLESAMYSTNGCGDELLHVLRGSADIFLVMIVLSLWFEAISMFLAMWVVKHIKNNVRGYKIIVKY